MAGPLAPLFFDREHDPFDNDYMSGVIRECRAPQGDLEISRGSGQILFAINAGIVYASEAVKKTDQKKGLP